MATRVEYLVVCASAADPHGALAAILKDVLGDDAPDDLTLASDIEMRYGRVRADGRTISGIAVTFEGADEEADQIQIADFTVAITHAADVGIEHAVKLGDPQLQSQNEQYAREIFEIEMRLREALSFIFIDTYGSDFYELLRDVDVHIPKDAPSADEMRGRCENEFFFLLFSDYIRLDSRRRPKKIEDLIDLMARVPNFAELQIVLGRPTVVGETYSEFVAGLKQSLAPIEELRNAVAHNRAIPERVLENYQMARSALLERIEVFMTSIREPRQAS